METQVKAIVQFTVGSGAIIYGLYLAAQTVGLPAEVASFVIQLLVAMVVAIVAAVVVKVASQGGASSATFFAPPCYVVVLEKGHTLQELMSAIKSMGLEPVMVSA